MEKCLHSAKATFKRVRNQILKGADPERATRHGYENACDYFDLMNKKILIQQRALACLSKSVAHILQRELYTMGSTGLLRREAEMNQTSPVPGRRADQGPVSGRSKSEHSDSGGPDSVLRVDNKSGDVRTKANSGVFLCGLRIPSRFSPCKTHSREMAQTSGFDPTSQVKTCFDCKILMSLIGLLASMEKMVPEGRLHMRPFQFHLKEHWRFPQSLDTLPWTETISAHLEWWQNPTNVMKGSDLHTKDLKRWLVHSLRANLCKRSVVRQGKKATHKCSRAEGGFSGPSKVQGPVSKPNSVSCHRQLNSGSLHKQTRRNPLGGDVCTLLWKIMTWRHCYQITLKARHIPGCLNVMADLLSRSNQVQLTEWSLHLQVFKQICLKWFTPHVDLFATRLNHKVSLYVSPVPDQNAWDIDALNINWSGLTAYSYPLTALLHRVIQKVRQSNCLIIVIAPGWPGMPWFWDLVQLSTEIPLQLPVSRTLLKQSHNYVFHSNPQHLNLHVWYLGVDSSKNKASLWKWQRELLPLRDRQQGPSTNQSWSYLKNGAEKIQWISPLPL